MSLKRFFIAAAVLLIMVVTFKNFWLPRSSNRLKGNKFNRVNVQTLRGPSDFRKYGKKNEFEVSQDTIKHLNKNTYVPQTDVEQGRFYKANGSPTTDEQKSLEKGNMPLKNNEQNRYNDGNLSPTFDEQNHDDKTILTSTNEERSRFDKANMPSTNAELGGLIDLPPTDGNNDDFIKANVPPTNDKQTRFDKANIPSTNAELGVPIKENMPPTDVNKGEFIKENMPPMNDEQTRFLKANVPSTNSEHTLFNKANMPSTNYEQYRLNKANVSSTNAKLRGFTKTNVPPTYVNKGGFNKANMHSTNAEQNRFNKANSPSTNDNQGGLLKTNVSPIDDNKGEPIKTSMSSRNDAPGGLIKQHLIFPDECIRIEDNNVGNETRGKQKANHIMFLKVHKAGSTTMEYLFFRFGIRHNLTFVLPKNGVYVLTTDDFSDILPIRPGSHYDVLASHTIYNSTRISRLLPEDKVNIAIIREPFDRMMSAAYYYRDVLHLPYLLSIPKDNFISSLIQNNSMYEKDEFSRTKNSMAMDFGFPSGFTTNMTQAISSYISKISSEFSLILIMERFEESLILMRRLLHWELYEVLHIAANKNKHTQTRPDKVDLQKFRSMCFLDYALYDHFLKLFETKIVSEGQGFAEEVEHFKFILNNVNNFCNNVTAGDSLKVDGSKWNCPFILTHTDCKLMKMDVNVVSLPILRERHIKMHGL